VWRKENIFPQPEFSPQTDRPVASCYTDCCVLRKVNGLKFKEMKKIHHELNKNVNFFNIGALLNKTVSALDFRVLEDKMKSE
jgi:hypothetical protein